MPNKDMIKAACASLDELPKEWPTPPERADNAINAALEAAWPRFNPDDPETCPKTEFAPSGLPWMKLANDGSKIAVEFGIFNAECITDVPITWKHVIRYCDPADILPRTEE